MHGARETTQAATQTTSRYSKTIFERIALEALLHGVLQGGDIRTLFAVFITDGAGDQNDKCRGEGEDEGSGSFCFLHRWA